MPESPKQLSYYMLSKRYTIVVADRGTGVVRRFTIRLKPALTVVFMVVGLPMLIGMGAAWKAKATYVRERAGAQPGRAVHRHLLP